MNSGSCKDLLCSGWNRKSVLTFLCKRLSQFIYALTYHWIWQSHPLSTSVLWRCMCVCVCVRVLHGTSILLTLLSYHLPSCRTCNWGKRQLAPHLWVEQRNFCDSCGLLNKGDVVRWLFMYIYIYTLYVQCMRMLTVYTHHTCASTTCAHLKFRSEFFGSELFYCL